MGEVSYGKKYQVEKVSTEKSIMWEKYQVVEV